MDFHAVLRIARQNLRLLVAFPILFGAVGLALSLAAETKYLARSTLVLDPSSSDSVSSAAGQDLQAANVIEAFVATQLKILEDRSTLADAAKLVGRDPEDLNDIVTISRRRGNDGHQRRRGFARWGVRHTSLRRRRAGLCCEPEGDRARRAASSTGRDQQQTRIIERRPHPDQQRFGRIPGRIACRVNRNTLNSSTTHKSLRSSSASSKAASNSCQQHGSNLTRFRRGRFGIRSPCSCSVGFSESQLLQFGISSIQSCERRTNRRDHSAPRAGKSAHRSTIALSRLPVVDHPFSQFVEGLRSLRTSIEFLSMSNR